MYELFTKPMGIAGRDLPSIPTVCFSNNKKRQIKDDYTQKLHKRYGGNGRSYVPVLVCHSESKGH